MNACKHLPIVLALLCLGMSHAYLISPSGKYLVMPTVNKDRTDPAKYLCLRLHLRQRDADSDAAVIQTGASDTHKWALGWMADEDIVVLASRDIGTRAYRVLHDRLEETKVNEGIKQRAEELMREKHG